VTGLVPLDRRQRRRQESIAEVLDVAVAVMGDQGVAGLTLGEVARRMGIRPPSLYVYFDGKNALYDALFERGWRELLAVLSAVRSEQGDGDPAEELQVFAAAFVRWAVEHPAYAPLMFWRPVPGFIPSAAAYAAA
jgi:AcrR family transcriptional regulator